MSGSSSPLLGPSCNTNGVDCLPEVPWGPARSPSTPPHPPPSQYWLSVSEPVPATLVMPVGGAEGETLLTHVQGGPEPPVQAREWLCTTPLQPVAT